VHITIKGIFAHKKCVAGNIDPVMMCEATTDKIEQEVKRIIDSAVAGGRFIFMAGCSIPTYTPLENVEAMIKSVHRYGRY
jgi:uroporphyrinogen-III decarboxylase